MLAIGNCIAFEFIEAEMYKKIMEVASIYQEDFKTVETIKLYIFCGFHFKTLFQVTLHSSNSSISSNIAFW